jgi:acid stress chaperone HdeB
MKRTMIFAAALMALSTPVKAQMVLEMSLITCDQFLSAPDPDQELIAAWMGGYFSATKNLSTIDFRYEERNRKVVVAYCGKNKKETLMSAIQRNAR